MKLLKLAALACILCLMTTGCDIRTEPPENLLNDDIVYNKNKNKLYNFVNQSLDGANLLLPNNSSEVGEINELDSNVIAFQRQQDVNSTSSSSRDKVGFVLISKSENEYKLKDSHLQEGKDIEYANFYDLNNDGEEEVVLLINTENGTILYIYSIENDKIELVSSIKPDWLKNSSQYTNTKIKIGFFDDDFVLDILMLNINASNSNMYATILNLDEKNIITKTNSIEFNDINYNKDIYIVSGKVYNNKKGIVLSIPINKDNAYITQIITLKDNEINVVFDDENLITNSYHVPVKDSNLDGILELPVLNNRMIDSFSTLTTSVPTTSGLITWKQWNNKEGENANTIFISQVYYNYKDNFRFWIPNKLANKLYIKKRINGDSTHYSFNFYEQDDKAPLEIFEIAISSKNLVEDAKSTPKLETILGETENNYYQLLIKDKKAFEKYNLTIESIKESFSLIYK